MKKFLRLIILSFLLFTCCLIQAQAGIDTTKTKQTVQSPDTTGMAAAMDMGSLAKIKADAAIKLSPAQADTVNHYQVAYIKFVYDYRVKLYTWQLTSARILFVVVVIIVLFGLYLSYLQFKASVLHTTHRASKLKLSAESGTENAEADHTKIEISKDGIKIDSAVIGLVILVISIVFFFLYLKFVFPIHDTIQAPAV